MQIFCRYTYYANMLEGGAPEHALESCVLDNYAPPAFFSVYLHIVCIVTDGALLI